MTAGRTFFIKTYGCQMNERDSEAAAALLSAHGFVAASTEAEADILVINTCSVRGKAEEKALGKAGLMVATKRMRPDRRIGLMGCMVQRLGEAVLDEVPGLDFALGPHRLALLPSVIDAVLAGEGPVVDAGTERVFADSADSHRAGGISAFINILYGCNRRCTYCIVPEVRGPEWSRPGPEIVDEVRRCVEKGTREVTLLGQSVMSYGRANPAWAGDYHSPRGYLEPLPRLLEAVGVIPGLARIRFTSGHPSGCTDELARAMAEIPSVCEHLHLPVQSGSDRILERMRRGYTADGYREAVKRLRARVPTLALTTDIIVGFPGETEEDFEATRRLVAEVGFSNAFIFKYSPRPGTPAAEWKDDVSPEEKLRRNHVLLADIDRIALGLNGTLIGQTVEAMADGVSLRNATRWAGRTRMNTIAIFEHQPGMKSGDMVRITVERAGAQTLHGRITEVIKS